MGGLTDKQQAFVYAYVQCLNATEAAALAGYQGTYDSLRSIGSQNLTKKHIRAAIDTMLKECALGASEVLSRLSDQARGIPADCFTVLFLTGEDGNQINRFGVDFEKLKTYGLLHLVKKLSYDRDGQPQVEFYDAQAALVHLGRNLKLFTDKMEHSGQIETVSEDDREDILRKLSGLAASGNAADVPGQSDSAAT